MQWNNISNGLPGLHEKVLVYAGKDGRDCSFYDNYKFAWLVTWQEGSTGYNEGRRDIWFETIESDKCFRLNGVTHWMKLEAPQDTKE